MIKNTATCFNQKASNHTVQNLGATQAVYPKSYF